jgi:hypothetical protein
MNHLCPSKADEAAPWARLLSGMAVFIVHPAQGFEESSGVVTTG